MKKFLQNNVGKIFLITIIAMITWIINLFSTQFNPYTHFLSLYYPDKYLLKDIFIASKRDNWSRSGDTAPQHYSSYGFLLQDPKKEKYDLSWANENDVPWEIFRDTLIGKNTYVYTPIFKSKIQNKTIYPVNDPSYLRNELISDFLLVIFFSIPIITVPFFIYLFYLGYLERKNEKKN